MGPSVISTFPSDMLVNKKKIVRIYTGTTGLTLSVNR